MQWRRVIKGEVKFAMMLSIHERLPSVYVHIPFCEVKCGYCDFFSVPRGYEDFDLQNQYVEALIREMQGRLEPHRGRVIHSLFFGGGTPSLLDPTLLERILHTLRTFLSWGPETEVTLESNPKTVSLEKLRTFRSLGINRLSIGVQSFQDRFLKTLGRIHSGADARRTVDDALKAGFENVSCDMIFALPGQTFEDWQKDLQEAISLGTPHLSAYHLTIEGGTAFDGLHRKGKLNLPSEEEGVRCLTWTREALKAAGLDAYEISNFARIGRESVHNKNYWEYGEYFGFGTAAASFTKNPNRMRRTNVRDLKKYVAGQYAGSNDGSSETISPQLAMGEFCMLGLRMREGIEDERFQAEFGCSLSAAFRPQLTKWQQRGWLERGARSWMLTADGLLFADEVAASFLP